VKEPIWLIKSAVIAVHDMMIARFGGSAGIRDEGLIDSALARPANKYHYDNDADLTKLAAAYADGIVQNHPFVDGNKRTGFIAAYMFLDLNGFKLIADEVSATAMTLSLAASEIDAEDYGTWLAGNIEMGTDKLTSEGN
jgi:death-on-curing protein